MMNKVISTLHAPSPLPSFPLFPEKKNYAKNASGMEWLEEIPSHWSLVPLFFIAKENVNRNVDGLEKNVLSLSYGHVVRRDISENNGLLPESFGTYQIVRAGYIVLRLTDLQNDKKSLRVGFVTERGIITSAYIALIPAKGIKSTYLYYLLHSYDLVKVFYNYGGGVRQSMKFSDLKRLPILIPPPKEQEAIVCFLDKKIFVIDTLIADKERLIKLLKEKRSALISHAVTKGLDPNVPMKDSGVEWLGKIPEHWETCRLKFLVRMVGGGTPSKENSEFWQGNIPWVSPKDMKSPRITDTEDHISEEALVSSATSLVEAGRVLLVVRSGILRNTVPVAINECPVSLNQDMKALIVRGTINPEYLFFLIKGLESSILALCTKAMATVESIEMEDFRTLEIPLPPLKEQSRCVFLLNQETEQINSAIRDLSDSVNLLKEYRSALITAAVTGQIGVQEATI
jgi:type I restriction enzyme S subunit